ncbi:hypothetical protein J4Q44_G00170720 [Coregonus suidteri]|uniref:Uncharacterized protein n=1 Tax=Coregonus suidteri TaxID=861788 RepID=A0AAN8LIG0_9TELE
MATALSRPEDEGGTVYLFTPCDPKDPDRLFQRVHRVRTLLTREPELTYLLFSTCSTLPRLCRDSGPFRSGSEPGSSALLGPSSDHHPSLSEKISPSCNTEAGLLYQSWINQCPWHFDNILTLYMDKVDSCPWLL